MRAILDGIGEIEFEALGAALRNAGFTLVAAPPASVFISCCANADTAIANAKVFVDAVPFGQEALVVNILQEHTPDDWQATRAAALLWGFTRHAAIAWAPRRIRVNAIGLGSQPPGSAGPALAAPATLPDIAATILAMWQFPSMTGQLISLGRP